MHSNDHQIKRVRGHRTVTVEFTYFICVVCILIFEGLQKFTNRRIRNAVDGGCGHRSRYLAHAKRALYHLR